MWSPDSNVQGTFKVPSTIPQDLLMIQDLVEDEPAPTTPEPARPKQESPEDVSIESSDDDTDSELEVEHSLIVIDDTDEAAPDEIPPSSHEDSDSSSDSSSDPELSDMEESDQDAGVRPREADEDEDEEQGPSANSATTTRTKNEVADVDIPVPDISEVGPDESLEKVGEIMSFTENTVIVRGFSAPNTERAYDRALDSDTLLVFEDRKVLGYVYETFGPTYQPLYQVKFSQAYPIDPERVKLSRSVYHVPKRSKFVFLSQLKHLKGSDASNAHDEEPAEEELEFSDDEQEAAHKRRLKEKRVERAESRAGSVAPTRQRTPSVPLPSQMRDQDMASNSLYGGNPYAAHGPYDVDVNAGPSRPAPLPYNDPYSEEYSHPPTAGSRSSEQRSSGSAAHTGSYASGNYDYVSDMQSSSSRGGRGRGRGRGKPGRGGREGSNRPGPGGGRDGGRNSVPKDRNRRERGGHGRSWGGSRDALSYGQTQAPGQANGSVPPAYSEEEYDPRMPRPLSPTSLVIARATGQYSDGSSFATAAAASTIDDHASVQPSEALSDNGWSYSQYSQVSPVSPISPISPYGFSFAQQAYAGQQYGVQPHINPRFASMYGLNLGGAMSAQYAGYSSYAAAGGAGGRHGRNASWGGQQQETAWGGYAHAGVDGSTNGDAGDEGRSSLSEANGSHMQY